MNTYPEHIGNELANMTDEELKRVLNQFIEKTSLSEQEMFELFDKVLKCRHFDYNGYMDESCMNKDE